MIGGDRDSFCTPRCLYKAIRGDPRILLNWLSIVEPNGSLADPTCNPSITGPINCVEFKQKTRGNKAEHLEKTLLK